MSTVASSADIPPDLRRGYQSLQVLQEEAQLATLAFDREDLVLDPVKAVVQMRFLRERLVSSFRGGSLIERHQMREIFAGIAEVEADLLAAVPMS